MITETDPRIELGYKKLKNYWDQIGPSDQDVLSYIVNPQFMGAPPWPNTRQAYRVVRPKNSLIIASDGLSDPFVGTSRENMQGYGCEVYVEVPEFADAKFDDINGSWAFALVENFAQNIAYMEGISEHLEKFHIMSMEFPFEDGVFPDQWMTKNGTVGALINLSIPERPSKISDMPFGPVDIICLTLLKPEELNKLAEGGAVARNKLAEKFSKRPEGHICTLERELVE